MRGRSRGLAFDDRELGSARPRRRAGRWRGRRWPHPRDRRPATSRGRSRRVPATVGTRARPTSRPRGRGSLSGGARREPLSEAAQPGPIGGARAFRKPPGSPGTRRPAVQSTNRCRADRVSPPQGRGKRRTQAGSAASVSLLRALILGFAQSSSTAVSERRRSSQRRILAVEAGRGLPSGSGDPRGGYRRFPLASGLPTRRSDRWRSGSRRPRLARSTRLSRSATTGRNWSRFQSRVPRVLATRLRPGSLPDPTPRGVRLPSPRYRSA